MTPFGHRHLKETILHTLANSPCAKPLSGFGLFGGGRVGESGDLDSVRTFGLSADLNVGKLLCLRVDSLVVLHPGSPALQPHPHPTPPSGGPTVRLYLDMVLVEKKRVAGMLWVALQTNTHRHQAQLGDDKHHILKLSVSNARDTLDVRPGVNLAV